MVYSPVNPWTFPVNPSFPWLPAANTITSISQSNPCVVTTGTNHGYIDGLVVKVFFPFPYAFRFGMIQINGLFGAITVLSPNSFSIPINTINFDPFVVGTTLETAQILPVSELAIDPLSDEFHQVNPANPHQLVDVKIFQKSGLQAPGPFNSP